MAELMIDTDILIDFARNVADANNFIYRYSQRSSIAISSITHMELLIGCKNKREQQEFDRFLRSFDEIKVSDSITDRALTLLRHYRLSHGLLISDCIIAATALTLGLPLATNNTRDFKFIHGLNLLSYP